MKKILLSIFLSCQFFLSFSQNFNYSTNVDSISMKSKNINYYINATKFVIISIELNNYSQTERLMWFEKENTKKYTNEQKIINYFFKTKNDFSLIQLANENLVNPEIPIDIYYTFVKVLKPNVPFRMDFLFKNGIDDKQIQLLTIFLDEKISIINKAIANKLFKIESISDILFKENFISFEAEELLSH